MAEGRYKDTRGWERGACYVNFTHRCELKSSECLHTVGIFRKSWKECGILLKAKRFFFVLWQLNRFPFGSFPLLFFEGQSHYSICNLAALTFQDCQIYHPATPTFHHMGAGYICVTLQHTNASHRNLYWSPSRTWNMTCSLEERWLNAQRTNYSYKVLIKGRFGWIYIDIECLICFYRIETWNWDEMATFWAFI